MTSRAVPTVLCTGNIVYDILVRPVDEWRWGTTTWVETIERRLGGNGASTSYALARLGVPVRLLSAAGRDSSGDELLALLGEAGVMVSEVARLDAPTATTVALVNSAGNRLFLHRPGASAEAFAAPLDFAPALLDAVSHFHLANVFALPSMRPHAAATLQRARQAGLTTSLDTGWDALGRWLDDLAPSMAQADVVFVNEDEARMLTNEAGAAEAAAELLRRGAGRVVVKLGARGCAVFSADGGFHVPAFEVEAMDTTGAGDCFAAGYLAALQRGWSHEEAARFANAVGALAVQRVGAVAGVLTWEESESWMRTAKVAGVGGPVS
jgi:sugar/nucleoside kinase (ribokinase family)